MVVGHMPRPHKKGILETPQNDPGLAEVDPGRRGGTGKGARPHNTLSQVCVSSFFKAMEHPQPLIKCFQVLFRSAEEVRYCRAPQRQRQAHFCSLTTHAKAVQLPNTWFRRSMRPVFPPQPQEREAPYRRLGLRTFFTAPQEQRQRQCLPVECSMTVHCPKTMSERSMRSGMGRGTHPQEYTRE